MDAFIWFASNSILFAIWAAIGFLVNEILRGRIWDRKKFFDAFTGEFKCFHYSTSGTGNLASGKCKIFRRFRIGPLAAELTFKNLKDQSRPFKYKGNVEVRGTNGT